MRWRQGRRSSNIEDRRGSGPASGGRRGGMRIPVGGRRGGIGGIGLIIIVVAALYFGVDPRVLFEGAGIQVPGSQTGQTDRSAQTVPGEARSGEDDELKQFVSVVLGSTEDTWHGLFGAMGKDYEEPTLVLFSGSVNSACGFAQAAMGPFYCPRDRKVYIDLSFYRDLRDRLGAPGDFAQAYVIAHEVGHHVQTLLGISQQVQAARGRVSKADANALSVRLELQADCFAGVWANRADEATDLLEDGDVEEGLTAAAAIGDDRLQRQSQGYVVPESFTHGTSEQRVRWFSRGLDTGRLGSCDTFNAERL